jgi:ABC-type polysaccharide/polyol phosphate export permease
MMLSGYTPAVGAVIIALVETAVLVVLGWLVFARLETTMADEI